MNIKYPKGEKAWVTYCRSDGTPIFAVTSKPLRDMYFLYSVDENGELKKLGKSKSPSELEEKYEVFKHMFEK